GQTRYETSSNRVEDLHKDDRYRLGLLQQRRQNGRARGKNNIWPERAPLSSIIADPYRVPRGPTHAHPHVAILGPTECPRSLAKRSKAAQRLLVMVSPWQQHADPANALGLRACWQRPRSRRSP